MFNAIIKTATKSFRPLLICLLSLVATCNWALANTGDAYAETDVDLLFLSDEIKRQLDDRVRPISNREKRAIELHALMFHENGWDISYRPDKTYTAQQTFELREGNCLSLAALYIAAARYVDLPARFQSVSVPANWTPKNDYYLLTGHVNATIRLPRKTMHIEFIRTFFDIELDEVEMKTLKDDQALAEYHNNVAMELVEQEQYALAKQHMERATVLWPDSDEIWSNYGVLFKFNKEFVKAEKSYKKALKLNKRNLSTLTNLYVLLGEQGRHSETEAIAKKVDKYSRKNPFHLAKLAQSAFYDGEYSTSINLINKAIRKDKEVPKFYHQKAIAHYKLKQFDSALKALQKARKVSEKIGDNDDIKLYDKKIEHLLSVK